MSVDLDGSARTGRWGALPECCDLAPPPAEIRRQVDAAIDRRLHGAEGGSIFLSGGLDSSIVAFRAGATAETRSLRALSIGYDVEGAEDETGYAGRMAEDAHLPWQRLPLAAAEVPGLLDEAARLTEDPIQDPVTLPTVKLARAAAAIGKVVLTGDGSDEIWGGYARFERLPATLDAYYRRTMIFTPEEVGLAQAPGSYFLADPASSPLPLFDRVLRAEVLNRMRNYHLARIDKIAMGVGLEPRSPFLDPALVRFGLRIPAALKSSGGRPKSCLIQAYPELPEWLRNRRKQPFSVPIQSWIAGPLRDFVHDILDSPNAEVSALVDPRPLRKRIGGAAPPDLHSLAQRIWSLLQLQVWFRTLASDRGTAHAGG